MKRERERERERGRRGVWNLKTCGEYDTINSMTFSFIHLPKKSFYNSSNPVLLALQWFLSSEMKAVFLHLSIEQKIS